MEQGIRAGSVLEDSSRLNVMIEAIRRCRCSSVAAAVDEIVASVSAELKVPVGRVAG